MSNGIQERPASLVERLGLGPWLRVCLIFITIIAGVEVLVIGWSVVSRFMHIVVLLIASFIVSFLLSPLVGRLQRWGLKRPLAILLVYLVIFGALALAFTLLVGPLTTQLQAFIKQLPTLVQGQSNWINRLQGWLQHHGANVDLSHVRQQVTDYITKAAGTILGSTLAIVTGIVGVIFDLILVLAITFYLLLDGHAMNFRMVRLLPAAWRDRWFLIQAATTKVLGGYVRGQILVSLTVATLSWMGCLILGVPYPLVCGLLAFFVEFIPMIGPVLGMVLPTLLALFQPMPLVVWVVIYFIALQQVESNVIVPRLSGHAVGLHPLGVLLALLVGVELGGLGGALLAVPLAGIVLVTTTIFFGDMQQQQRRQPGYLSAARQVMRRRSEVGKPALASVGSVPPADGATRAHNDRLAAIRREQARLMAQFVEEDAARTAAVEDERDHLAHQFEARAVEVATVLREHTHLPQRAASDAARDASGPGNAALAERVHSRGQDE